MEAFKKLEFEYAKKLRKSNYVERRELYSEAYSKVSVLRMAELPKDIRKRTAGTSDALLNCLRRICKSEDNILEVGCGRGYTCLKLAPHVKSIFGTDVSDPALTEAIYLLKENHIDNVQVIKVNADELMARFEKKSFDKVISIDVYEHLHPEDAIKHLSQVCSILKPNGEYIIITPNRLNGPHDITKKVFPHSSNAIGFHLNETCYTELIELMKDIGFTKFRSFLYFKRGHFSISCLLYPTAINLLIEKIYLYLRTNFFLSRILSKFLPIKLIAKKISP